MSACCAPASCCPADSAPRREMEWLRLGLAALIAVQSMTFGLAVNLSPPAGRARLVIHGVLAFLAVAVFFLVGLPLAREAWRQTRAGRAGIEQLFLLGMAGAFFASLSSTWTGKGAIYYEVVAVLVAIYTFGRILAERRQRAVLAAAQTLRVEFESCVRLRNGQEEPVAAAAVRPGDWLRVRAGEAIGVDGIVRIGTAFVRETALTGEPFPVVKRTGDAVWAGSHVVDHALEIEATRLGTERSLDGLLRRVEEAGRAESSLQREADRLMRYFLPVVLLVVLATFAGWTWQAGWVAGMLNALSVLLVACPCAMGLATPITVWGALNTLARRGIVAQSGDFVEKLGQVDMLVFDKTGTLSAGDMRLADFVTAPGMDRGALREWVAAVEGESSHPAAKAFRQAEGKRKKEEIRTEIIPGVGIRGKVEGRTVEIGNEGLLGPADTDVATALRGQLREKDGKEIFICVDGRPAALALVRESLRETAPAVLRRLETWGVQWEIMTGDRAESLASLGLGRGAAGLSPQAKADRVRAFQAQGRRVLFVGDGVNDAAAMLEAHASLALSEGAGLARDCAQAQLFGGDLGAVSTAVMVGHKVRRGIRRNILLAAAYNGIGMATAAAGVLHPIAAALLMLGSSSLVTWRALRFSGTLDGEETFRIRPPAVVPEKSRHFAGKPESWIPAFLAVALLIQGPLLAYLGHVSIGGALMLAAVFFMAALSTLRFWPRWTGVLGWQMGVGMLALGNLAMLLGWWADAGFEAIVRDGACLCGCAKSEMGKGLVARFNWMQAGMVLGALPAMFWVRDPAAPSFWSSARRLRHAVWMTAGMLGGMLGAGAVMSEFPVRDGTVHFLITFAAMSLGMLAGMFAACGVWRKIAGEKTDVFQEESGTAPEALARRWT
jgi:Cu+-exporting ATPase